MGELKLANASASDMTNAVKDVVVNPLNVDGVQDQDETVWTNTKFSQYWGYFNEVPDLKGALLMKAIFNVGKGFTADPLTTVILDHISGWGKDTFEDILFNMEVMRRVAGDSFAEIVRADDGTILNIKPLDPGTMRIVVNRKGQILRYEQFSKIKGSEKRFAPEDIFHLSNNRLADQIHGISDIESIEKTILAENQTFDDINKVMHRQARPMIMFKVGTDDTTKIANFISKMDAAVNKGENIYIPDDVNSVEHEVIQVNVTSMLLEWRNDIRNRFYRTIGLPQVVPGAGGQSTESESKTIYLAFEGIVERDQRFIENAIWSQLQLRINLYPPTSMSQDLQSDTAKDGIGIGMQPSDTTAGVGR